ncbi:hypothetical protein OF83DRAFT_1177189 [Amylostereum chailletii]|nr:hypothetical protein OF83DRAFT_1177189 [Amylostereum chailletii]
MSSLRPLRHSERIQVQSRDSCVHAKRELIEDGLRDQGVEGEAAVTRNMDVSFDSRGNNMTVFTHYDSMSARATKKPRLDNFPPVVHPPILDELEVQATQALEKVAQSIRQAITTKDRDRNTTGAVYERRVDKYEVWWKTNQTTLSLRMGVKELIPAFPITAAKVTLFLEYEMGREKQRPGISEGGSTGQIAGSTLGKSSISGMISALEKHRKTNAFRYRAIPEAQIKLRDDECIWTLEQSAAHNEPKRIDEAQVLKASGTSSDSYTPEKLQRRALWCLSSGGASPARMTIGICDRAMLLLSSAPAFRGDSAREVQWSDLYLSRLVIPDIRPDYQVPVLGILADNAKHNQNGRVDEHGAIRHRIVELCPVGALALHFFAHFQIMSNQPPKFAPDFNCENPGKYGRREWYQYRVFFASEITKPMTYQTHNNRVNAIHKANGISSSKVTHAG